MAQDRPTLFPRWATNPPAGPPTDVTEPTSAQKDSGWQPSGSAEFPDGKPVRQIMNWLQNFAHQWVQWLDQSKHAIEDFSDNQVLPILGVIPTLGAGRVIASGDFSAAVYAGDGVRVYRVPLTALADPPATGGSFTYPATSDTYWDLRQDCVWVATSVAAMATAPAVAANSERVYAVRTDAVDRTALILDNMTGRTHLWLHNAIRSIGDLMVAGQLEIGAQTDDAPPGGNGTPPDFDTFTPRVIGTGRGLSGEVRWQVAEFDNESGGIQIMRVYMGVVQNRNQIELVWGARCTGNSGTNWITDSSGGDAFRIVLGGNDISDLNFLRAESIIGFGPSNTFSDSDWSNQNLTGQLSQLNMPGGLRLGSELNEDAAASRNSIPLIERVHNSGTVRYTLVGQMQAGTQVLREYDTINQFGTGTVGRVRTWNAEWNEVLLLWQRDDNSKNSFMRLDWEFGHYRLFHESTGSATWSDAITAGSWGLFKASGIVLGQTRDRDSQIFGAPFTGGQQYGYGTLQRCRKIIMLAGNAEPSVEQYTLDSRILVNLPSGSLAHGLWPITVPGSDVEIAIPFHIPHESVIVSMEVNYVAAGADRFEVEVSRMDADNIENGGSMWEALQSGGKDITWPSTAADRLWNTVGGLDQNLTIDNQRFAYQVAIRNLSGQFALIWAIRIDYDVRFVSGM